MIPQPPPVRDPRVGRPLSWVSDGQKLWFPYNEKQYAIGIVVMAAGRTCRVQNHNLKHSDWYSVSECYEYIEPKETP